jgi:prevent-host-death family protein
VQGATPNDREEVGVRELRDHLSRYLDRVKAGAEVVVTEHGHPIAYLGPRPRSAKLAEMIATGRARAPLTYRRGDPEPVEFHGTDEELDQLIRDNR